MGENLPDIITFFGRFHPIVVHLPIGFLLLAILAQFSTKWPKFSPLKAFVSHLWGLGALSALLAVVFGYMLSLSGDYDEETLFLHKWSGVVVLITSLLMFFLSKKYENFNKIILSGLVVFLFGTLTYTGHLGGNLTHGSTYLLEYAPNPVRELAGLPPKAIPRKKVTTLDSADVFLDIVQPILDKKCVSCHNDSKKKGDLLLTSHQLIIKGGENGDIVIPGNTESSELFRRITLPEEHKEFMPTEGKRPLSETEVELLEWWIEHGALSNGIVTQLNPEKETLATINSYLGLDKNNIFNKVVLPPKKELLDSLKQSGFVFNRLMRDNHYLEANFSLSENAISNSIIDSLLQLKDQLVWLNLSNVNLKDAHLQKIGELENLVKLDLSRNAISDNGIEHLSKLINLESLNLYNTQVSEKVFDIVSKMTRLKTIYLWNTKVNDSVLKQYQSENKTLKVIFERDSL